ncbi:rab11 family-interacting protein 3 isoform X2 [Periophthalmus magnuspinnatus]|uniref:rab11 family-interacting protein 3 isoform X2 n=1 Tax=Periophthalmus magnuspinnatus TaxID=409849 RepID=UPI00145C1760|nr:rab11 family-interacting protein 3 isoform X2 [Periophthalmus magnuspinnatus]
MEPALLSGPLGHTQWETEQPFPLGFHSLDSDNGSVLCQNKSGQTGLDVRNSDQDHTFKSLGEEVLFQNKVPHLDSLINIAELSGGEFKRSGDLLRDHQTNSQALPERTEALSCSENGEPSEVVSDSTLSWLFSPGLFEVSGKGTTFDQSNQPQEPTDENSHAPSYGTNAQTVSESCLTENIDISKTLDSVLLVDFFSDEHLSPHEESVTEEVTGLSLSPVAVSPDIGDKGLYPDQVTDLPLTSTSTTPSLPENCLLLDHTSTLEDCFQRSVPLLDIEVPFCDNSLCPATPVSPPLLSIEQTGSTVTANQGYVSELEQLVEISTDEADNVKDDTGQDNADQNEEMKDTKLQCEIKNQDSTMALDLCPATEDVHNEKHPDTLQTDTLTTEAAPEPNEDSNHLETSDILDFSAQDSSVEADWTNKQSVEALCLSKMVGDDSVPIVPTVNTSEEDVSLLKAVFDALDQDGDGFVRIEEFMEFAAAYGADQVKDLTKFLDPSGLGVISFEDFRRGISAISNGGPEPQLYGVNYSPGDGAVGCPEEYDEQNEVTDSAYLGSESTYSECETFTDEDTGACVAPEMHEDVETDSGIEATLHDPEDRINRFSLNAELHNHSPALVIGGEEEHFEDFGESNTSELLETSVAEIETDGGPPLTKTADQLNGSSLPSPSAGKRLSSKKVARHLLQNSSMTLDTVSDLTRDILELADNDITDKVLLLERRVAELEKESEASGEQHTRLRQENLQLVHRANAFEEQLKEQELYADEQLQQETRRHKDAISKLERERGLELENLQTRLQQLDEENSELRSCIPCLRANIERLEEEKKKLQDETEALSDRLEDEMENRRKLANKLSHERHINQKEKESTQELIEDLRKQLEHLQLYKLEIETKRGRTPGAGLQEYQTRTREAELEQEIKRLKQDNRSLKEQNDELNGQIINLSIQGAKTLMSASFSDSLAAEISSVSRAELMETVHKQEEINYRLQDYIDKIIVAIMECNPSILEVK